MKTAPYYRITDWDDEVSAETAQCCACRAPFILTQGTRFCPLCGTYITHRREWDQTERYRPRPILRHDPPYLCLGAPAGTPLPTREMCRQSLLGHQRSTPEPWVLPLSYGMPVTSRRMRAFHTWKNEVRRPLWWAPLRIIVINQYGVVLDRTVPNPTP